MKKINITKMRLPEKSKVFSWTNTYGIYLGNELDVSFSNKRKAIDFLAATNKFLNITIQEINILYIQVFSEYRRSWFIIDFDERIDDCFDSVNKYFRHCVTRSHFENGNYFTFINIYKICDELQRVIELLRDFNKKYDSYNDVNIMNAFENRLACIRKAIECWGKDLIESGELKHIDRFLKTAK